MLPSTRRIVALAVLLAVPAGAPAQAYGVRDGAGLFKPKTIEKANEQIEQIRARYHTDLLIETVKALSADQSKALRDRMDVAARNRFFAELAEKQAEAAGATGVYVWILKSPPRTEVVVGADVSEELFTPK